jgi:hypothetical protein
MESSVSGQELSSFCPPGQKPGITFRSGQELSRKESTCIMCVASLLVSTQLKNAINPKGGTVACRNHIWVSETSAFWGATRQTCGIVLMVLPKKNHALEVCPRRCKCIRVHSDSKAPRCTSSSLPIRSPSSERTTRHCNGAKFFALVQ